MLLARWVDAWHVDHVLLAAELGIDMVIAVKIKTDVLQSGTAPGRSHMATSHANGSIENH